MVPQKVTPTKTNAQLLKDVFNYYKATYKNELYEAYEHSADKSFCLRISNEDVVDFNAPTLALKKWGEDINNLELILLASEPYRGFNEKFPTKLFSIYSQNITGNIVCGSPNRTIGGISNLMIFEKDSVMYNLLIIDLITKVNTLVASGVYGLEPQPVLFS